MPCVNAKHLTPACAPRWLVAAGAADTKLRNVGLSHPFVMNALLALAATPIVLTGKFHGGTSPRLISATPLMGVVRASTLLV